MFKFKSIPQDEWEQGESVICDACGAHLRHYVEEPGRVLGHDCFRTENHMSKKAFTVLERQMKHVEGSAATVIKWVEGLEEPFDWVVWFEEERAIPRRVTGAASDVLRLLGEEAKARPYMVAIVYVSETGNELPNMEYAEDDLYTRGAK